MLRTIIAWSIFPVLSVGAVVLAVLALDEVTPFVVAAGIVATVSTLVFLLEGALPYRSDWQAQRGDLRTDLCHFAFSNGMVQLAQLATVLGLAAAAAWLSTHAAVVWPRTWPLAAQLALAIAIYELGGYWLHRLQHERGWLWRF